MNSDLFNRLIAQCQGFLKKFNMHFFGMDRIFKDGRCFRFGTNRLVLDFLETNNSVITGPIPQTLIKQNFSRVIHLFSANHPIDQPFNEFSRLFKAGHVIDFIERRSQFYDQAWFFSSLSHEQSASLYLTHQSEFLEFISQFQTSAAQVLLEEAKYSKLIAPSRLAYSEPIFLPEPSKASSFLELTPTEATYLPLIVSGLTAREIAEKLEVSTRTSEHHLENIKEKLGCRRKSELIQAIRNKSNR